MAPREKKLVLEKMTETARIDGTIERVKKKNLSEWRLDMGEC